MERGGTEQTDRTTSPSETGHQSSDHDSGDPFVDLYREHNAQVFRYLHRQTFCPEIAADLTAETFAQALSNFDRWDPLRGTRAQWLFGIARNQWRMWARSSVAASRARQRYGIVTPTLTDDDYELIEADLDTITEQVRCALDKLSSNDRTIVILRVVERRSYADIPARHDCTENAARTRVSRALARLRRHLSASIPDLEDLVP